jgi:hypothetical protein
MHRKPCKHSSGSEQKQTGFIDEREVVLRAQEA